MFKIITSLLSLIVFVSFCSCNQPAENGGESANNSNETRKETHASGEASVKDDVSEKNILQVAVGSEDHSTLVTAVKTADMEHILTNAGPLTVFAPTNAAFDKLPDGTVESLLKPENKAKLQNIIEYHAAPGSYGPDNISGVEGIGQANMQKVKVTQKEGDIYVNDAKVVASVKAANGWVHVIDAVLLPPEK